MPLRLVTALLLISLPALGNAQNNVQNIEPLARCFHDQLYPAPELFPPQNLPPSWQAREDGVSVIWYGASASAKGAPITYGQVDFAANGEIRLTRAKSANGLDQTVINTRRLSEMLRARIDACKARL